MIAESTTRSRGIQFEDDGTAAEWFAGIAYNDANSYQIGYDPTGGQAEIAANAFFKIDTSGYVYMSGLQNTSNSNYAYYNSATGELTYNTTSDIRLKNISGSWQPDSLTFLRNQDIVRFDWKDGSGFDQIGYNANQMSELMPSMTWKDEKGYWNYYDVHMRYHFHRAIKQLDYKFESAEDKIKRLEARIEELEDKLK
jgi:hypothetical protein